MNNHDDLGRDLGRALRDRVDGLGGAGLTLDDVKGRATRIRRRQAMTAGAAVAAVLAITVPTALTAGGAFDRADREQPPATSTPSPSPTATPAERTGEKPMDFRDLGQGAPPAVVWTDRGEVRHADDMLADLQRAWPFDSIAQVGDRFLVVTHQDQTARLVDSAGKELGAWATEGSAASSPDDKIVAFAAPDGSVTALQQGGRTVLDLPAIPAEGPFTVTGVRGEDCTGGEGCAVYVTTSGQGPTSWVTVPGGKAERITGLQSITAVGDRLLAGITDYHADLSTCSALLEPGGAKVSETCDHRVFGISTDGRHVLAHHSVGSGFGEGELALLDASDASLVASLMSTEQHQGTVMDAVWEDDSHVLAVTYVDGAWGILRFGLDGSKEWAVAPRAGEDVDRPFYLADAG